MMGQKLLEAGAPYGAMGFVLRLFRGLAREGREWTDGRHVRTASQQVSMRGPVLPTGHMDPKSIRIKEQVGESQTAHTAGGADEQRL